MPPGDALYKNPQRAFVEIFTVEDGAADDDDRVEGNEDARVEDELCGEEVDVRVKPGELAALEHVPYND